MFEFFKSYRKKNTLHRLMKRLAVRRTEISQEECMAQVDDSLALAWKADQQQAEAEFIEFVMHDPELVPILSRFEANEEKINHIYRSLSLYGAGQWLNETYIAAAALATPATLESILQTLHAQPAIDSPKIWIDISSSMVKLFSTEEKDNT